MHMPNHATINQQSRLMALLKQVPRYRMVNAPAINAPMLNYALDSLPKEKAVDDELEEIQQWIYEQEVNVEMDDDDAEP